MSALTVSNETHTLQEQLASIEAKLDYVVERQRFLEELIDDMMPVARDGLAVVATRLQELEDKGVFVEARRLADNAMDILDTVRNLTQPDVLGLANDATDVLHHSDDIAPIGLFGAMRATKDDDVQRGMALALALLQKIGRATHDGRNTGLATTGPARTKGEEMPAAAPRTETPRPIVVKSALPPEPDVGLVEWEGRRFHPDGFLADPSTWDEVLATKIAAGLGIVLAEPHWKVIRWARHEWQTTGASPNVRRLAIGSGVGTAAMYELFPKTPGKSCSMIAGIPKPVGCV